MTSLAATPARLSGRSWMLAVLTLVYTFNHVDRQILVILLEPIKLELGLRDSQLGMLTGLAFAVAGLVVAPVAEWTMGSPQAVGSG